MKVKFYVSIFLAVFLALCLFGVLQAIVHRNMEDRRIAQQERQMRDDAKMAEDMKEYLNGPAPTPATGPEVEYAVGESGFVNMGAMFFKSSGTVKNLTAQSLKDVFAAASYYDKKGNFITSTFSKVDYDPILAGQTSPWSILLPSANPEIASCKVEFRGGSWNGQLFNAVEKPKQ